jgi:hypothetical protein
VAGIARVVAKTRLDDSARDGVRAPESRNAHGAVLALIGSHRISDRSKQSAMTKLEKKKRGYYKPRRDVFTADPRAQEPNPTRCPPFRRARSRAPVSWRSRSAPRAARKRAARPSGWFRRFFSSFAANDTNAARCPPVATASPFDLAAYVESHPWYVQEQQPNAYQPLSSLFCVRAAYAWEDAAKRRVAVLNTANEGAVDGPRTNERKTKLRAVVPDETVPSKLAVGPRFVPSASYGPYWVLAVKPSDAPLGEDDPEKPRGYDWAVVSGGQPNVPGGKDTCRTSLTGVNGSGLWIFTRDPTPSYEVV